MSTNDGRRILHASTSKSVITLIIIVTTVISEINVTNNVINGVTIVLSKLQLYLWPL